MGRFYQTTNSPFVDYMFKPNLNMRLALANEEIKHNYLKSKLLQDVPDITIPHLNFEAENERVKSLQNNYENKATNLAQKIYNDPDNASKYVTELRSLQKEMLQDKTSGNWYNVEQRYNDYSNWLKENEKLKESNPALYNQLNAHWYNDVINRAASNPQARFAGQKIIEKPDLINDYRKLFENIKANSYDVSTGGYIINNKSVTEEEVATIAWNTLVSDKNYMGYVNQMGNVLGQKGYIDENGNPITPFNLVDENGETISYDKYNKLSSDEKKKVKRQLNPKNAFYHDLASVAQTFSFKEQSVKPDQYGLVNQRSRNRLIVNEHLEKLRHQNKINELVSNYLLQSKKQQQIYKQKLEIEASKGSESAQNLLNRLNASETIGVFKKHPESLNNDRISVKNNQEKSFVIPFVNGLGERYITINPATTEYAAQQRIKNATEYGIKKFGNNKITLSNGETFKLEEYFRWLGDRKHTEETANKFLEKVKSDYPKQQVSIAQNFANNTRGLPGFLKTGIGKDRDKLYEIGNEYEKQRDKWYDNYNKSPEQLNLQPINNPDITKNIVSEIKKNPENFTLITPDGEIPKKFANILSEINNDSQLYFTAANNHSELGMKTKINGKNYFIFPNNGNTAEINLIRNLSLMGVDPDSEYFKEMSDRIANNLAYDLRRVGKNSKGTKSIIEDINGIKMSIELVNDEIYLRTPDKGLNTPPDKVFSNIYKFVKFLYNIQK